MYVPAGATLEQLKQVVQMGWCSANTCQSKRSMVSSRSTGCFSWTTSC
jgi:hypothetical protein